MKINVNLLKTVPQIDLPTVYDDLPIHLRRQVREEYVKLQKGLCYFCKKPLKDKVPKKVKKKYWLNKSRFPDDFFKYPIHLHHNHDTGLTIGAVHCYCNAVLAIYFGE